MSELEKVKKLHEEGKIGYVTIDTSILEKYIHEPASGMCKLMGKFKLHGIKLVISTIVKSELIKHKVDEYEEKREKAKSGLNAVKRFINIQPTPYGDLIYKIESHNTFEQASALLEDFESITECEILDLEGVETDEIYDKYFQQKPPFGKKKDKKHEFPDAAALISLRNLADKEGKYIVVVAKDNDWKSFCGNPEKLIYTEDLKGLLSLLDEQEPLDYLFNFVQSKIDNPRECQYLKNLLYDSLLKAVEEIDPMSDSSSAYRYEIQEEYATLDDFNIIGDVSILSVEDGQFAFELELEVSIISHAHFSFYIKDEGEYTSMGDTKSEVNVFTNAYAVISFDIEEYINYEDSKLCIDKGAFAAISIAELGVVDIGVHLEGFTPDHGDVEPSWMSDPENFDY